MTTLRKIPETAIVHATTMVIAAGFVAVSKSPVLDLEAKALIDGKWVVVV